MDIVTYALLRKHGGGGASDLEDLTDINITSPTDGQVLKYDATNQKWVNGQGGGGGGASELNELDDVNVSSPARFQGLVYDSITQKWVNGYPRGVTNNSGITNFIFSNTLLYPEEAEYYVALHQKSNGDWEFEPIEKLAIDDLTDVNITTLEDGQVLKYDATNNQWVNGQGGGGSQIVTDALEVFKKLNFSEKFANDSVTSPFVKNGNAIISSARSSSDSDTNILSTTKVDLTNVGYFVIDVYKAAGFIANWYPFFYVCQDDSTVRNTSYPSSVANKVYLSNVGKYYLDTSSLTGEWYIGLCTGGHTDIVCEAVGKLNDTLPITTIEVVANPQGTPVGKLNTIQIGDAIYELPSGGGKSFTNVTYNPMSNNGISTTVTVEKEED